MSILIRGMDAPKSCFDCKYITLFRKLGENRCSLLGWAVIEDGAHSRLSDCPIKELPPHGRLIDADAFAENLKNVSIRQGYKDTLIGEYLSVDVDDVIDAIIADLTGKALCGFELNPTIIPADKGETE